MRFPKPRRREVRTETIILTGGLNEVVTTLELKKGELIQCLNYMEVDGPYHGYASLSGYEAYDGKEAPSDIGAPQLPDEGNDDDTLLLIESPNIDDISRSDHEVDNFGAGPNDVTFKFASSSFEFGADAYMLVQSLDAGEFSIDFNNAFNQNITGINSFLNLGTDWTVDLQIRPKARTGTEVIYEKPGCYKLEIDALGLLTFFVSSDGLTYDYSLAMITDGLVSTRFQHVSIVAKDSTLHMAVDGVPIVDALDAEITETYTQIFQSASDLYIGGPLNTGLYFNGWMDEFRISIGYRWISRFTPPVQRYSEYTQAIINFDDIDREEQRLDITEVPGVGDLLGVHIYQGEVYALRNKDGVNAALYRAFQSGDDLTAGWVLVDDTFNIDGSLNAHNERFSGNFSDQQVMVIVDGKSIPRVWDGTAMVLLTDATLPDNQVLPRYAKLVSVFDGRILLAYAEDDIFLSAKDVVTDFSGGFGTQLNIGDDITNLRELPGEAMAIICRNSIKTLEKLELPTSATATPDYTFRVQNFSKQAGGIDSSCERLLSNIIYADDRGIVTMEASDKYGDFEAAAISKKVNRIYLAKKNMISTSVVDKSLNQYRLFFDDGSGLVFTFTADGLKGATYIDYGIPVMHAAEGEDLLGDIIKVFSSEGGFVYSMDKGTSFNGNEIPTELFTSYYHYKSPRYWKQFMRMMFEITASRGTSFLVRSVFDYNSVDFPETAWWGPLLKGLGGIWGSDNWSEFTWGGAVIQRMTNYIRGHGTNMSIELVTNSKYNATHIVHNVIVDYQVENIQE